MKRFSMFVGIAVGLVFLASASAAPPLLNTIKVRATKAIEYTAASEGTWLGWTQASVKHPNSPSVFVKNGSGPTIKVNVPHTHGEAGGFYGDTFVYYEWKGHFAGNIRMFNLKTHRRTSFPSAVTTPFDEYNPTMSGPWVLFTRYIDTSQTTKVLLYNMQSRQIQTLDTETGKNQWVYAGQVNWPYAAWGRVTPSGQDVYLYDIETSTTTMVPHTTSLQYDPAVSSEGAIYYVKSGHSCGAAVSLNRYVVGGVATDLHNFPSGTDIDHTYVDQHTDGSLHLLFGQFNCHKRSADIYKVIDSHTITVSKAGTGTGTVTSGPTGINCGAACSATFHGGLLVTFTATPADGSVFSGWSDPSCGTNPTCQEDVESDTSLTATFDPSP